MEKRKLVFGLIVIGISGSLTLVLVEIILSLLLPLNQPSLNHNGTRIYNESREFHHSYNTSQVFTRIADKGDNYEPVENRINSLGFRGPEVHPKKENEFRILFLGDSFIQADETKYENTLGQIMEQESGFKDLTVFQVGMASWFSIAGTELVYQARRSIRT